MNKLYNMFKGLALNAMASRTIEADPLTVFHVQSLYSGSSYWCRLSESRRSQ